MVEHNTFDVISTIRRSAMSTLYHSSPYLSGCHPIQCTSDIICIVESGRSQQRQLHKHRCFRVSTKRTICVAHQINRLMASMQRKLRVPITRSDFHTRKEPVCAVSWCPLMFIIEVFGLECKLPLATLATA